MFAFLYEVILLFYIKKLFIPKDSMKEEFVLEVLLVYKDHNDYY